jgi:hypothetical protein
MFKKLMKYEWLILQICIVEWTNAIREQHNNKIKLNKETSGELLCKQLPYLRVYKPHLDF